jgi:hypothetical protein
MIEFIKTIIFAIRHGEWSCGYNAWYGKPMLGFYQDFYDGWRASIHVGKFWVEVYY